MDRRRWMLAGSAVLVVLVMAFAAFRPDKLFIDEVVSEQLDSDVEAAIAGSQPLVDNTPSTTSPPRSTTTSPPSPGPSTTAPPPQSTTTTSAPPTTTTTPPVIGQGQFVAQAGHSLSGSAFVVRQPEGLLLVLPELDSQNGPDLHVYLSPRSDGSVEGGTYVEALKGNRGTQTYLLPSVDLESQPNVVIWCRRFSVPFGTATLR